MPMYIIAQFHAKPGCELSLLETLRTVIEPTRAEAGCMKIHLYEALRDPSTFFIQSVWKTEADFELHAQLPHTVRFLKEVANWIDHEVRPIRCARLM